MNRDRVDVEGDFAKMPQNQCLLADCNVCFPDRLDTRSHQGGPVSTKRS